MALVLKLSEPLDTDMTVLAIRQKTPKYALIERACREFMEREMSDTTGTQKHG